LPQVSQEELQYSENEIKVLKVERDVILKRCIPEGNGSHVSKYSAYNVDCTFLLWLDLSRLSALVQPRYYSAAGDVGGHQDCRFFGGAMSSRLLIHRLSIMLKAWTTFADANDIEHFICHGTLLSWWWGHSLFPWDVDVDIQLNLKTILVKLVPINGSLIEGRYLIDVNPAVYQRRQGLAEQNLIDAVLIDTETGVKIDMIGLSLIFNPSCHLLDKSSCHVKVPSDGWLHPNLTTLVNMTASASSIVGGKDSDRHVYPLEWIYPLVKRPFLDFHVWTPKNVRSILQREFGDKSMFYTSHFDKHYTNRTFSFSRATPLGMECDDGYDNNRCAKGDWSPQESPRIWKKLSENSFNDATARTSLPLNAFDHPDFVTCFNVDSLQAMRINPEKQLTAEQLAALWSIDVDNKLSKPKSRVAISELTISVFNAQRGTNWHALTELIRADPALNSTDVWLLNELDLGMSRSLNLHTSRLLAHTLNMNYAWGIEFIELTAGNKEEHEFAAESRDCPTEWRGTSFVGKVDSRGLTGNAILSRYPLNNVTLLRFPGTEGVSWNASSSFINAHGYEKRHGSRMAIYATLDIPNSRLPIHVGSFHLMPTYDVEPEWSLYGKKTLDLMKREHHRRDPSGRDSFILGGDGWGFKWCEHDNFFAINDQIGGLGDWICSRNHRSFEGLRVLDPVWDGKFLSDHPIVSAKVHVS